MQYLIPFVWVAAALAGPFPAFAAGVPVQGGIQAALEDAPQGTVFLVTLDGMMCGDCQKKVEAALGKIDGVGKVVADWQKGTVQVTMKDAYATLTLEQVQKALADLKDFTVKEVKKA